LALALANSKNGFLVIDEAENGIHHSMQRPLWKMVLQTALKNNVQVFAATHSWDCVRGFAKAMLELEDADGVLIRLERHGDNTRAVEYSEDELRVAAEQGIEVR
jgi:AAA15 family ATPase/GTPase